MYIGSQGIVHGNITILNAARKIDPLCEDLSKIFVTSGLGGECTT